MHPRRKIINALKNKLSGNIPEVGTRVFTNRSTPLWDTEIPGICIYWVVEDVTNRGEPKYYVRVGQVVIEVIVSAESDSDELVDDILEQVEDLILHDRFVMDPDFDHVAAGTDPDAPPEENAASTADDLLMRGTRIELTKEKADAIYTSGKLLLDVTFNSTPSYVVPDDKFDTMHVEYELQEANNAVPEAVEDVTDIYQE